MKKFTKLASRVGAFSALCLTTAALVLIPMGPVKAQTTGTKVKLGAYWDNGTAIAGTVTLTHTDANNTVVTDYSHATSGWVSTTLVLQPNILYTVTLAAKNPSTNAELDYRVQFLVPGLIIDPAKIVSAAYRVTISRTTNLPVPGETHVSVEL
jgi:hypothetical protein